MGREGRPLKDIHNLSGSLVAVTKKTITTTRASAAYLPPAFTGAPFQCAERQTGSSNQVVLKCTAVVLLLIDRNNWNAWTTMFRTRGKFSDSGFVLKSRLPLTPVGLQPPSPTSHAFCVRRLPICLGQPPVPRMLPLK